MALEVCSLVEGNYIVHSEDRSMTQPILTIHEGTVSTIVDKQLYLRRTNSNTYSNIKISVDNGSDGWIIKLGIFNVSPTEEDWDAMGNYSELEMGDIDEDNPIRSFWIRVVSPDGISIDNKYRSISIICDETV